MSAFEYGRSQANVLPATDQDRFPCRSCSVTSGNASASLAASSIVAISRPYPRLFRGVLHEPTGRPIPDAPALCFGGVGRTLGGNEALDASAHPSRLLFHGLPGLRAGRDRRGPSKVVP